MGLFKRKIKIAEPTEPKLITDFSEALKYVVKHESGNLSDLEKVIDKKLIEEMALTGLINI